MSQERWDVVIRYLDGPLSMLEDQVYRGPVIRFGSNPGPGGVKLQGYRGLDARHAVITCYDGGTVAIASVGSAQIRIATHQNADWSETQPIIGPTYLSDGSVIHLGAPGRGISFLFVESQRLGVWEQRSIISDSAQVSPEVQPTNIKELKTDKGIPAWFTGGIVMMGLVTTGALLFLLIKPPDIEGLGPIAEGKEKYEVVSMTEPVNVELKEGLSQPFSDFVMKYNAEAAKQPKLADSPSMWDQILYDQVTRSFQAHSKGWAFFKRLETVVDDYAYVTEQFVKADLPAVFAAIPYQESGFQKNAQSLVCAKGYFQFMPESAFGVGIKVSNCKMRGSDALWSPTKPIPKPNVMKNAEYVDFNSETEKATCKITSCEVDERTNLQVATRGAIRYLSEPWEDETLRASGALVQLSISSFNGGYDDSRHMKKGSKPYNILPAYNRYLSDNKLETAPSFVGDNIKCSTISFMPETCGAYMINQTQHYAYNIIAEHLLAVCYYGRNHKDIKAFQDWGIYTVGDGYCTRANIPLRDEVLKRMGK